MSRGPGTWFWRPRVCTRSSVLASPLPAELPAWYLLLSFSLYFELSLAFFSLNVIVLYPEHRPPLFQQHISCSFDKDNQRKRKKLKKQRRPKEELGSVFLLLSLFHPGRKHKGLALLPITHLIQSRRRTKEDGAEGIVQESLSLWLLEESSFGDCQIFLWQSCKPWPSNHIWGKLCKMLFNFRNSTSDLILFGAAQNDCVSYKSLLSIVLVFILKAKTFCPLLV